jgi:hypothetical protein
VTGLAQAVMRGIIAGILGVAGFSVLLWVLSEAIERFSRAGRVIDEARRESGQAVAFMCKPCNSEEGDCSCPVKCGNELCPAEDTGVSRLTPDDVRWLRSISVKEEGTS